MVIQLQQLQSLPLMIASTIALSLGGLPAQATQSIPTPLTPHLELADVLTQQQLAVDRRSVADARSIQQIAAAEVSDAQFKTLFDLANQVANGGDYPKAIEFYEQIIAKLRTFSYKPLLASSLWRLGSFYQEVKDYPQALKNLAEAAQIAASLDDRELLKNINLSRRLATSDLANQAFAAQQYAKATTLFEQSLVLAQQTGDASGQVLGLLKLAEINRDQQYYRKAIPLLEQALRLANDDATNQVTLLMMLGRTHDDLSEFPQAQQYYQTALKITRDRNDGLQSALILNNIGGILLSQGDHQAALDLFKQALTTAQAEKQRYNEPITTANLAQYCQQAQTGNDQFASFLKQFCATGLPKPLLAKNANDLRQTYGTMILTLEGNSLNNLGVIEMRFGNYQSAIARYQSSLSIQQPLNNPRLDATGWNNIGDVYAVQGDYKAALTNYEKSLGLSRQAGNRNQIAATMSNVAQVYQSQGQLQRALETNQAALTIFRAIGDRQQEATALGNRATTYVALAEYDPAQQLVNQALGIYRELNDKAGEATSLNNLAVVVGQAGDYDQAIKLHEQSLAIAEKIGDREKTATVLGNLGRAYVDLAQYAKGIDYYNKSLALHESIGTASGTLSTQGNLAGIYRTLGQYDKSLALYRTVVERSTAIGENTTMGVALAGTANILLERGDFVAANTAIQQALTAHRASGAKRAEIYDLRILGKLQAKQGQPDQALASLQQGLNLTKDVGPLEESLLAQDLAEFHFDRQQYGDAETYANRAIGIAKKAKYQDIVGESLTILGRAKLANNQAAQAIVPLEEAVGVWEKLRPGLKDSDQVSLFDTQAQTYESWQQALIAQGQSDKALEVAERGRARAFVELFATKTGQNPATLTSPTLAQMKTLAQQQKATLVEYSQVNDRTLYIWVVKPTGEVIFHASELPKNGNSLVSMVQESRSLIGVRGRRSIKKASLNHPDPLPNVRQASDFKQLHQVLIAPIAQDLPSDPNQTVIFMPQGALFYVPFAALEDAQGKALIEQHTIAVAPSIQSLELTSQLKSRSVTASGGNLIVGNPSILPSLDLPALPGAEAEAKAVSSFLQTTPLLGDRATKSVVLNQMTQARIIHFATHGLLDTYRGDVPGAVVLAAGKSEADSLLTSSEIADLKLKADLVVLSACSTGKGDITGDGVIGLSRSLFLAGVPSVMVSLWDVDDAATAQLMTSFYRHWQSGKLDKAQALRQAILETRKDYPEPSLWAAFNLVGETR
jgi:CHAT domain-containing protein/predicted negative regulator of RcsB-dependent stress response